MTRVEDARTVGEVVAAAPATARVFERHGIDYCCGGGVPLAEACRRRGLDPAAVLAEIEACRAGAPEDATDWTSRPLADLVAHLLDRHHAYLRRELPRLGALSEKVLRAHGERHPQLVPEVARLLATMSAELGTHLLGEEQVLFPAILDLEAGRPGRLGGRALGAPLSVLEQEHRAIGETLARLRDLTSGYRVPADACRTFQALYAGLEDLERDLHRHIHLENNVLHARARRLAAGEG